jgi:hypothetical protein
VYPRRNLSLSIPLIVGVHTLLLACYVFPASLVHERLQAWGQAYARPFFHQQWRLFAPDPPLCSCGVEVGLPGGDWRPIDAPFNHYLQRRQAQGIARYVQAEVHRGDTVPDPALVQAMRSMVRDIGREVPDLRFRLVEQCVEDPQRPMLRTRRITRLHTP